MDQYRQYQSYVTTSGTCNYKIDACIIILGELIKNTHNDTMITPRIQGTYMCIILVYNLLLHKYHGAIYSFDMI